MSQKSSNGATGKARVRPPSTVVVLGTGGTIAGLRSAASPHASGSARGQGYVSAQLEIADLVGPVGLELSAIRVQTEQVAQVDSKDMTHELWRALAQRCVAHLARRDVRGVVITHGTDTMEETAYFLHRVLDPLRKPVVLTGAMRPADHPRADGPKNLRLALTWVAGVHGADEDWRRLGRKPEPGVRVAFAGRILHPAGIHKAHPTRLAAFVDTSTTASAPKVAPSLTTKPPRKPLQLPSADRWPHVAIVTSHAGADARVIDALLKARVDGLVIAGTGNGTVHRAWAAALRRAQAQGVAVEVASRCPLASDPVAGDGVMTMAANPSPVKARIDLMLRLMDVRAAGERPRPSGSTPE